MNLHSEFGDKTINELLLTYEAGSLNLEPGFQRRSVWSLSDRRRLIESILTNNPIPGVFLYRRSEDGHLIYDVIDGKQRIESILMFTRSRGFGKQGFEIDININGRNERYDWGKLKRKAPELASQLKAFKIQTIELTGELASIIELFVRINSTGKPLTSGERRHAKFFHSPFLKVAERLVRHHNSFITTNKILSEIQLARMKGTELFSELLMSIHQGGIINKKSALDRAIGNQQLSARELSKMQLEFNSTIKVMRRMLPELKTLRFRNAVEFYTLFMVIWEARHEKLILNDSRNNKHAAAFLKQLSSGVDQLQHKLRKATPASPSDQLFADYLLTVQGNTDSAPIRQRRAQIIKGLIFPLFERRDEKRLFTLEQRRLLWHSDEQKRCKSCERFLKWEEITVDHVLAHTKGGKTTLENAQLLCKPCNSRKGGR